MYLCKHLYCIWIGKQGILVHFVQISLTLFSSMWSIISYAARSWYNILSNKQRLESIQKQSLNINLPELGYEEFSIALAMLMLHTDSYFREL